ncbi:MAG: two-component sensor histidine kinase, partial [Bacteroidetes bacterium]|nr:two-component sensor histidine kinase [Bacteroidota bacterium]
MRPYRFSVNLKLGLILFAVGLAVASLWYTDNLVDRLREREQALMQLWAKANEQVTQAPADNPYQGELETLDNLLRRWRQAPAEGGMLLPVGMADSLRRAVSWAQGMPPGDQLDF